MDTLKYTDDISNDNEIMLSSEMGEYCLESTDGGPSSNYVTLHDGNRIHEDDARYIDRFGEWYHVDDCVYSEYHGEDIVYENSISIYNDSDYAWDDCDDFKYVEEDEKYYPYDEVVWSEYHEEYLRDYYECVIHGFIKADESTTIEVMGKEYHIHESVTIEELLREEIVTEEEYQNYVENE
jgi:hypothetical protein